MACYKPLKAYRGPNGIEFNSKAGYADKPLQLKCGQCIGCRLDRTRGWAIRAVHEAQMHEKNAFLTLTYRDQALPDDHGLHVEDWQKFAKRVRKTKGPFRFLHCGEYSEPPNLRPHYHACLFGLDFSEDRVPFETRGPNTLYISAELQGLWPHGFATIGELTFDSAAYVAAYCLKKATGQLAEKYQRVDPDTGECWEVKPDYATMSLKPGLGKTWFERYCADIYPDDFVVLKGTKFRPPKYYDQLLEKDNPELHKKMLQKRRQQIREKPEEIQDDRLQIREKVQIAKLTTYGTRNHTGEMK